MVVVVLPRGGVICANNCRALRCKTDERHDGSRGLDTDGGGGLGLVLVILLLLSIPPGGVIRSGAIVAARTTVGGEIALLR